MGEFGFSHTINLLNLTADVLGQLFRRFFAFVIDLDFDKKICSHSLAVH
jgi:hypothetical protein